MKHIFFIIAILNLFACAKRDIKEHIQLSDFKNAINLSIDSGKPYTTLDIFNRPIYLYKVDSLLIAHDIYSKDKGIHFFANHRYIKSVGQIGRGANEIIRPSPLFIDKTNGYLWIADWGRVTYKRYSLDSLLNTDEFIGHKFNFLKTISYKMKAVTDTSILCMTQYEAPYLYRIISESGKQNIAKVGNILKGVQKLPHPSYMTSFDYNPVTHRIYMAFRNIDVMMCIDTTGKVIFLKKFFDKIGFDKKVKGDRNEISTFSSLKILNDKIFVLYCGVEYFSGGNVGQPIANYPDKLMIFDLAGNPLTLIKFDGEISDYIYDSDNKELIVYSLNSEIYPLISYKIEL